jgi:hypothetical protein
MTDVLYIVLRSEDRWSGIFTHRLRPRSMAPRPWERMYHWMCAVRKVLHSCTASRLRFLRSGSLVRNGVLLAGGSVPNSKNRCSLVNADFETSGRVFPQRQRSMHGHFKISMKLVLSFVPRWLFLMLSNHVTCKGCGNTFNAALKAVISLVTPYKNLSKQSSSLLLILILNADGYAIAEPCERYAEH